MLSITLFIAFISLIVFVVAGVFWLFRLIKDGNINRSLKIMFVSFLFFLTFLIANVLLTTEDETIEDTIHQQVIDYESVEKIEKVSVQNASSQALIDLRFSGRIPKEEVWSVDKSVLNDQLNLYRGVTRDKNKEIYTYFHWSGKKEDSLDLQLIVVNDRIFYKLPEFLD